MANKSLVDQFIKDKHNKVVIYQNPNTPLSIWIVLSLLNMALHKGSLKNGVEFTAAAVLITWAYLEITNGASYFRRTLGVVVLAATLLAHFK